MFRSLAALIAPILLLSLAPPAVPAASSVTVPAEFREIVSDATLIIRGRVTAQQTVRSADGEVGTVSTVAVDVVLKGTASTSVSILVPGGRLGRYRSVMVGAPRFERHDAAVFFLKRGVDGLWRPVGLAAGVFRIQPDRATGRLSVRPPVVANRTASTTGPVVRGDERRRSLTIAEFDALVRATAVTPGTPIRSGTPTQPIRRLTR
jgi:hypothetical protein